ncbi:MAG TPA: hypothetical protein VGP72_20700 [Planctomycetota bacterium]|jgi:hypothetical protein
MFRHLLRATLAVVISLGLSGVLRADTIVMRTGQIMDGEKLSEDDNSYEVKVQFGTLRIPKDKVLRIDPETEEQKADRERKAQEAEELAEEMKAEGKVLYKGKWVTEKEKKVAEDKAAAEKKKKAEKVAAERKKKEEEAKKKAEDEKRLAQQQQQNLLRNGQLIDQRNEGYNARHNRSHGGQLDDYSTGGSDGYRNNRGPQYNQYNQMYRQGSNILNGGGGY